jgi:hypothetical protein
VGIPPVAIEKKAGITIFPVVPGVVAVILLLVHGISDISCRGTAHIILAIHTVVRTLGVITLLLLLQLL